MRLFARKLNDDEAAAVLTYVRNSWGSSAPAVDANVIKQPRASAARADR
jgi:mono/diheme cytochrome c family protein